MEIKRIENDNKLTFVLSGSLNINTSNSLQDSLLSAIKDYNSVVLDFTKLHYVSSAGLRVLLAGEMASKKESCTLKICNVSEDAVCVHCKCNKQTLQRFSH